MARRRSESKPETKPGVDLSLAGKHRFDQLNARRQGFIKRCENYAMLTIPKECLPGGQDQNTSSIQHDWSSVGAQLVNHVTSKIVTTLFSPGMPFFRLDPDIKLAASLAEKGIEENDLKGALVAGEQRAIKVLDQKELRPKLFETIRGLVITGNKLLDLSDDSNPRAIAVKDYVCKRSMSGRAQEILHYEKVLYDELTEDAQAASPAKPKGEDGYVDYVRWFKRKGNKWYLRISINNADLGEAFAKDWAEDEFPVYPLCWDLADKHDYGTGLVEDNAGDFGILSTLTESELKAAILASDFRWLANPGGVGDIEEFKHSQTGDVIPGVATDLSLVAHNSASALQAISASGDKVINRLARTFLMGSAVTRDAERVTAEEIRMQAAELETSLGGVYSRLAITIQLPLANWLLKQIDVSVKGTRLTPTIVTGIAALSRNAEAQQMMSALTSLGVLNNLQEIILKRLKLAPIITTIFGAYGINAEQYTLTEEQVAQQQEAEQQAAQETAAQQEINKAGATRLANQE